MAIDLLPYDLDAIWTKGLNNIVWSANDICPFKCWYCPKPSWGGDGKTPYTWGQCSDFLDILFERIPRCTLLFTGGEPTDWPLLPKMLDKIYAPDLYTRKNPGWYIVVISNMSKSKGVISEWIDKTHHVCASYHSNVINTPKKREAWLEKVLSFKHKTRIQIRLLMDPKQWDHCIELYNDLNDPDIVLEPVPVLNKDTIGESSDFAKEYTSKQVEILNELKPKYGSSYIKKWNSIYDSGKHRVEAMLEYSSGDTQVIKSVDVPSLQGLVISRGLNRFKGWHCEIGLNDLYIDHKGRIAGAVCMGLGAKYIGNIIDIDNIKWPEKAIVCPYEWCLCGTDTMIPKYKL